MEEINKDSLIEKMIYSINDFKDEIIKSMNYIREDMNCMRNELKGEIKDLRQELRDYKEENNRRWDENDKRWEENNRRWDENEKRWDENRKMWKKYEENRAQDRREILEIFTNYDISISKQLGDSNTDKMLKLV